MEKFAKVRECNTNVCTREQLVVPINWFLIN